MENRHTSNLTDNETFEFSPLPPENDSWLLRTSPTVRGRRRAGAEASAPAPLPPARSAQYAPRRLRIRTCPRPAWTRAPGRSAPGPQPRTWPRIALLRRPTLCAGNTPFFPGRLRGPLFRAGGVSRSVSLDRWVLRPTSAAVSFIESRWVVSSVRFSTLRRGARAFRLFILFALCQFRLLLLPVLNGRFSRGFSFDFPALSHYRLSIRYFFLSSTHNLFSFVP